MTPVPPVTNDLQQLEGTSRGIYQYAQGTIKDTPHVTLPYPATLSLSAPYARHRKDFIHLYLKSRKNCKYRFSNGSICGERMASVTEKYRHWMAMHAMNEVKEIESGALDISRATIITTRERLAVAKEYRVYCPYKPGCRMRQRWLVRPPGVVSHLRACANRQNIVVSLEEAKVWCNRNMALLKGDNFISGLPACYQSAIWRIHKAS